MEEDIRKQGILYLQQQRFGKKWKRVWCVLYRESSCSISRLEFYECKDGGHVEKNDKSLRKQQEHKKVIRLSDCIRVTEVDMDSCPRDTGPFLVETTDKIYVFAADRQHLDDWTHKLCEIAFPVSWVEHHVKRGSLQRGRHVDENEGMEDNSLYSGRETVRDFRVCVRRTEASDRCRLKGDGILHAGADALHLLDKTGDVVLTWPYRYLRRFGRDKSTFSFEAGRRCESGEGSFEFDTKQGNFLFQSVEAAINLQRSSAPHRQASSGGRASPERPDLMVTPAPIQSRTLPPPQPRSLFPQATGAQEDDCVYSVVSGGGTPSQQSCLEPTLDKTLTGVKSLTLDARGVPVPRKSQVKMISSCPLPAAGPELGAMLAPGPAHHLRLSPRLSSAASSGQMYSEASLLTELGSKMESRGDARCSAQPPPDPDYSLPFDTIAKKVVVDRVGSEAACGAEAAPDPLYDSIDEMQIRNIFLSDAASLTDAYGKVEHIYDEPEGRAVPAATTATAATAATVAVMSADLPSVYDDPEEMRGDAWRIMGTTVDPKGHEYPYNPRLDDYAIPKRVQRAFPTTQRKQEDEEEEEKESCGRGQEPQDSPYNNVIVKKQCE